MCFKGKTNGKHVGRSVEDVENMEVKSWKIRTKCWKKGKKVEIEGAFFFVLY